MEVKKCRIRPKLSIGGILLSQQFALPVVEVKKQCYMPDGDARMQEELGRI